MRQYNSPHMNAAERANQRNAVLAGFLGWTLDAFDFFVLTFVIQDVATAFGKTRPDIALTVGLAPALLALFIRARVKESAAWHEHRVDWKTSRAGIWKHWPRFLYLVLLMTMMTFMSHGTQDMYPTFLQQARHYSPSDTASLT